MKKMACVVNKDTVQERCKCPCCGASHLVSTERWAYEDYTKNGPVVGKYPGWDDALVLLCPACEAEVSTAIGEQTMINMYQDGEIELVTEIAQWFHWREIGERQISLAKNEGEL